MWFNETTYKQMIVPTVPNRLVYSC